MALTEFQRVVLRLLSDARRERGERYVAGRVALNYLLDTPRVSRDIDLFHDSTAALAASWSSDRAIMESSGFTVSVIRESPSFVEAIVAGETERCVVEWARDSTFRFFPLVEDPVLGLTLHQFDLATNKALALAGRLEVRDWVDVLACDEKVQPLGYLAFSSCGKDPGYNPFSLLDAARRQHYSQLELDTLDYDGERPDAGNLGRRRHSALAAAHEICSALPPDQVGTCVATSDGRLCTHAATVLQRALSRGEVVFHPGSIGGAWPSVRPPTRPSSSPSFPPTPCHRPSSSCSVSRNTSVACLVMHIPSAAPGLSNPPIKHQGCILLLSTHRRQYDRHGDRTRPGHHQAIPPRRRASCCGSRDGSVG